MVLYLATNPRLCRLLMISRYGLFCCFCSLVCFITSLELSLTVCSSMVMFGPSTHTISERKDVESKLGGMVAGGCFLSAHVSRSAQTWTLGSAFSNDVPRLSRTESCLHVYLPYSSASRHADIYNVSCGGSRSTKELTVG